MRLLWVENHAVFARMAGRQFLSDHEITLVPSLAAAKAALSAGCFDAVLLDFDLDDGKGVELIPCLRELPSPIPIIATSSHEDGNSALLTAGANAVCAKTNFAGVGAVLRAAIGDRQEKSNG